VGLDSVWVHDHLLYRWPGRPTDGIWECWTVVSALAGYADLGVSQLMIDFSPHTPAALERLGEAVQRARTRRG
jgi:hypothetical protein